MLSCQASPSVPHVLAACRGVFLVTWSDALPRAACCLLCCSSWQDCASYAEPRVQASATSDAAIVFELLLLLLLLLLQRMVRQVGSQPVAQLVPGFGYVSLFRC